MSIWIKLSYPWRRKWQPTPVFMPGKSHRWRSLVGYNPWGHKESDTTERRLFVCVCSCPYLCVLFPEGRGEHLNRQVRLQSPRRRHLVGEIQTCNKGAAQLTLLIRISIVLPASGAKLTTCQVPPTQLHIANYILGCRPTQCHQVICFHIKLQYSHQTVWYWHKEGHIMEQGRTENPECTHMHVCVSHLVVSFFCDPCQAPLSMEFSGQESGVVVIPFSSRSSQPRDRHRVSCIAGRYFTM